MQDRYAGDFGDFSKLGLLRALAPVHAGVVWYRVPDEAGNNDGKHTQYLRDPTRYRDLDPGLFDALVSVANERTVANLAARTMPGWVSFPEVVPVGDARAAWLSRALVAVASCDLVCLDPDNGLAPPSIRPGSKAYSKYATDEDVAAFAGLPATLVIYQHLHRSGTANEQAAALKGRLADATGRGVDVLRFRRGSGRLYGICVAPGATIDARVDALLRTWGPHFERAST